MTAPNLAQRMLAVNKSLGWVDKAGKNKEQNYAYVQAVDIFAAARAAYNEAGVVFQWSTTDQHVTIIPRENKAPQILTELKGDYAFINADDKNDVIAGSWVGQSLDVGDKGTWKATTGALKYVLIGTHLLPTGDDPENDENEAKVKTAASPQPAAQKVATVKPEASQATSEVGLTPKQIAKLMATFNDVGIKESASRKHITTTLVGKHSVKSMSGDDLDKILGFFEGKTDENQALVIEAMAQAVTA